ncbi:MAG: thioredoxin family protein [Planctomycetota bacterium]
MADFFKAVAVAKAEGKNLLVDTGSDWCGWCKRLHKEVFAHESWRRPPPRGMCSWPWTSPRDGDPKPRSRRRSATELSDMYGIQGFPTILLMTPDGDVFGQTGYQEGAPEAYLTHMAELKKEGLPLLEAVLKFETEYKAAEGEARLALWNRGAEMLKKNGGQMPAPVASCRSSKGLSPGSEERRACSPPPSPRSSKLACTRRTTSPPP